MNRQIWTRDKNMVSYSNTLELKSSKLNSIVMFALCILIFFQIFNFNVTSAALKYTLIPTVICFILIGISYIPSIPKRKSTSHYIFLILMVAFAAYSTFSSDVVKWENEASSLMIFILLYIIATYKTLDLANIKKLLKFYVFLIMIIAVWVLLALMFKINILNGRASISYFGIVKDQNYLSAFMVPGFAYILYSYLFLANRKVRWLFCAIIVFVAVYMTGSRAALISMLISILFMAIKLLFSKGMGFKKIVLIIAFILICSIAFLALQNTEMFARMSSIDGYTDNIRLKIWGYAMEGFYVNPIFGSGIQAGTYYAQRALRWYTHNCFIDILTGQGIIGTALYLLTIFDYFIVKKNNMCLMLVLGISSFVPLFFINGYETLTFWMPMIMCKIVADYCHVNDCQDLLL